VAISEVDVPVTYLRPRRGWETLNLRDLWVYRELFYFMAWRDVKVRYKQAVLGIAWAVIIPLVNIVIFSIIFGEFANVPSGGIPYPLLVLTGVLPWRLFEGGLQRGSASLVQNTNLITKVYFPRLVIPFSAVVASLMDFFIAFIVMIGVLFYYRDSVTLTWNIVWLLPLTLLTVLTAIAVVLWLSALNVQYRDVQHIVPFIITTWMYLSPVAYSAAIVPAGKWQIIYGLNPMAGVIQGFRWAILGGPPPGNLFVLSCVMVFVILITGLFYFRRMERTFADTV